MTQIFQNNMQNFKLQQMKLMMVGGLNTNTKQKLPPEVVKQIHKDYIHMYYAFVSINWGQGKTLGVSWQKGLEQMDAFVASKMKIANHPANNELLKIHTEFRKDMAKTIMTNPNTEEKLDDRLKKSFLNYGMKEVSKSKTALDNMYKKYMPENLQEKTQEQPQKAKQLNLANYKAQQVLQILMQQRTMERAA